jgi:hypothetical protein
MMVKEWAGGDTCEGCGISLKGVLFFSIMTALRCLWSAPAQA